MTPDARTPTPKRWRCPDCGIANQWDALECVRCRLIQPPDRERWKVEGFARSPIEALTPISTMPSTTDARTRLIALIAEMRESAADYRVYAGVPCQSESSWHAETFESWANRLQAVADALGEPHD